MNTMHTNAHLQTAVDAGRPWIKTFARFGYASRGVVYLITGFFAALAAYGAGRPVGAREAVESVVSAPFGSILAWVLAAGLASYAAWRLVQALFDADNHGTGARGLVVRSALLFGAFTYLALALYTLSLVRSVGGGSDGGGDFATTLAEFVGTRWAASIVALVLLGVAGAHMVKAAREGYAKYFSAGRSEMRFIHPVAKTGLVARGVIFGAAGLMLALSAWRSDGTSETPGSADALRYLETLPGGAYLLAATGLGLVAFALYSFAEARYRRINVGDRR